MNYPPVESVVDRRRIQEVEELSIDHEKWRTRMENRESDDAIMQRIRDFIHDPQERSIKQWCRDQPGLKSDQPHLNRNTFMGWITKPAWVEKLDEREQEKLKVRRRQFAGAVPIDNDTLREELHEAHKSKESLEAFCKRIGYQPDSFRFILRGERRAEVTKKMNPEIVLELRNMWSRKNAPAPRETPAVNTTPNNTIARSAALYPEYETDPHEWPSSSTPSYVSPAKINKLAYDSALRSIEERKKYVLDLQSGLNAVHPPAYPPAYSTSRASGSGSPGNNGPRR